MTVIRLALAALMLVPLSAGAGERPNPLQPSETWDAMKVDVVGEAEIMDGTGLLEIGAPYRAEDAAIVPITIREAEGSDKDFVKLTLVIDENPAPVAAEFEIGPAMGEIDLETRVRVNAYSNVRAIAETADGEFYMVGRYVKASGGCSAPALKDADAALAQIGKMKLRLYDQIAAQATGAADGRPEAQLMIRHPNYSGLQMNQVTQLYIPAHFVDETEVTLGGDLVFRMTAGISISEDPTFRFRYDPNGATAFEIRARDTEGDAFEQSFPVAGRSDS